MMNAEIHFSIYGFMLNYIYLEILIKEFSPEPEQMLTVI